MATSLHPNPTTFLKTHLPKSNLNNSTASRFLIRCGPRDNRGPLVKGRVLSIEAIQAVQSLKRAQRSDPTNISTLVSKTLSRLIKADLVATLKELLRQDQCALALHVFSNLRSEHEPGLSLYADLVMALAKNGMAEEIDRLIFDLEKEGGGIPCDDKGLIRLIRAVVGAERRESTVRIYGMMKRSGWGSSGFKADEYMVKALSRGLRRVGEVGLADEVDKEFGTFSKGNLEKLSV
ncbi:hypothetical protein FEM48_Zijuj01G0290500 [Ziziphus jujuba var. spinosa]|uniref:Protein THYLAKOID ASSEMBLY 8, chloroplastic n=1 Tax=Ziziphus jujuba var. spinosa TaxID=714518 RepID=A0A978W5M1_ZIZJJ|nr:hypothetical protein FEM48_Zijuj01G0290500 [Ziziphus jujuba var. spinosa]